MKKTFKKGISLCLAFMLMFALFAPVAVNANQETQPLFLFAFFTDGDELYPAEEFIGRISLNGNFVDYMSLSSRSSGFLRTSTSPGPIPKMELFIVYLDGYQNLGPFVFDEIIVSEDDTIEAILTFDIQDLRAMATPDQAPEPPTVPTPEPSVTPVGNGIYVDGVRLPLDVPPTNVDGRLLVPLRPIGQALGCTFVWYAPTRSVIMELDDIKVILQIDNPVAHVIISGVETARTLDVPPMIIDGRTLVPLRFIAEIFGVDVVWEAPNAIITTNP